MTTRRPNIWSYVSFSRPSSRADSQGTLPTHNQILGDLKEKPDRLANGNQNPAIVEPGAGSTSNKSVWRLLPRLRGRSVRFLATLLFIAAAVYVLLPWYRARRLAQMSDVPPLSLNDELDTTGETRRCTVPYDSSKPLVQYTLMIDAGSTGSRIHIYRFNNCGSTPALEKEVFKQTEPKQGGAGLSSYDADAEGAARSLDVLMDTAVSSVPEQDRSCSPVAVKATAGLRKLGPEKSDSILKAVRHRLETKYPFPVVSQERGGVQVMDGKDEGVYAWITTNYLLGNIGGTKKNPTAAVFDLGGGSTQIVFEPTFPSAAGGGMPAKLEEGDHKYDLKFGGQDFSLYQHSYLGYGLMAARENLHRLVLENAHEKSPGSSAWLSEHLENPCLYPGSTKSVQVQLADGHPLGSTAKVTMRGPQTGRQQDCLALAKKTLNKDAECKLVPCAFNSVHQPSLADTFAREQIYLFSYFFDRMEPLGMPDSFTLADLSRLAHKVCEGERAWETHFKHVDGAIAELKGRPEHCLDLNFMIALLVTGYEMPLERTVKIAKKIDGNELGWCLGASLPLLSKESGWTCRVDMAS